MRNQQRLTSSRRQYSFGCKGLFLSGWMVISTSQQCHNCAFYQTGWVRGWKLCQLISFSPPLHFNLYLHTLFFFMYLLYHLVLTYCHPVLFFLQLTPFLGLKCTMEPHVFFFSSFTFWPTLLLSSHAFAYSAICYSPPCCLNFLLQPFLFFFLNVSWFISVLFHVFVISTLPFFRQVLLPCTLLSLEKHHKSMLYTLEPKGCRHLIITIIQSPPKLLERKN